MIGQFMIWLLYLKYLYLIVIYALIPIGAVLFRLYDLDDDGVIVKDELFHVLRTSLLENFSINLTEKQMREVVDHTFHTLGCDRDGKLPYGMPTIFASHRTKLSMS